MVVDFSTHSLMDDVNFFREELKKAWEYMRESDPGSPNAAILAEQRRLESLDPRYRVRIVATATGMKIKAIPSKPIDQPFKLKIPDKLLPLRKALFDKGQSFEVKANEIQAEGSPLLSALLEKIGNAPVTIESGASIQGCLHLSLNEADENFISQIDGEWTLAPRRISFIGQLPDSPLKAQLKLDREEDNTLSAGQLVFTLDWKAWSGQPLLSLGYFDQLTRLANASEYEITGMIRGNRICREKLSPIQSGIQSKFAAAIRWLRKCRDAAVRVGVNPLLPLPEVLDGKEANDVRLLIKLLEDGFHEQTCANEPLELSADDSENPLPSPSEELTIQQPETKMLNFFGAVVPFTVTHTFTDMRFVSKTPLEIGRINLSFKGGQTALWRITPSEAGADNPS